MTTNDALNAWREEFLAEFSIDREPLDEALLYGQDSGRLPDGSNPREPSTEDRIPRPLLRRAGDGIRTCAHGWPP